MSSFLGFEGLRAQSNCDFDGEVSTKVAERRVGASGKMANQIAILAERYQQKSSNEGLELPGRYNSIRIRNMVVRSKCDTVAFPEAYLSRGFRQNASACLLFWVLEG